MSSPSDPLTSRLRTLVQERGLNPAALGLRTGIPADHLRSVLAGREPMTVDELILLSQALSLSPEDLGVELPHSADAESSVDPTADEDDLQDAYDPPGLSAIGLPESEAVSMALEELVDPFGNHARQLFEVGFALGCTFFFLAKAEQLAESGVPASVLSRYADGDLPIQLDAAYHPYNEPTFDATGVALKLSFDAIYDCYFPWSAIHRVTFFPELIEDDATPDDEEESPKPSAPFLRLVE
ncbi:MAG: helix-turn-helix domain-containing protein [Myxococcota bacterium]